MILFKKKAWFRSNHTVIQFFCLPETGSTAFEIGCTPPGILVSVMCVNQTALPTPNAMNHVMNAAGVKINFH